VVVAAKNGCNGRSIAKIFNNNNSGQLCPHPSSTKNQQYSPELLLLNFFAIDQPSPGFHIFSPWIGLPDLATPFLQLEWLFLSRFHFFL